MISFCSVLCNHCYHTVCYSFSFTFQPTEIFKLILTLFLTDSICSTTLSIIIIIPSLRQFKSFSTSRMLQVPNRQKNVPAASTKAVILVSSSNAAIPIPIPIHIHTFQLTILLFRLADLQEEQDSVLSRWTCPRSAPSFESAIEWHTKTISLAHSLSLMSPATQSSGTAYAQLPKFQAFAKWS